MEESDDEDAPAAGPATAEQGSEPNPALFVQGLPAEVNTEMLSALFQQYVVSILRSSSNLLTLSPHCRYPGLSDIRLVPVPVGAPKNSGSALIQYETAAQAGVAKEALDGFLVDRDAPMTVHWARRA